MFKSLSGIDPHLARECWRVVLTYAGLLGFFLLVGSKVTSTAWFTKHLARLMGRSDLDEQLR